MTKLPGTMIVAHHPSTAQRNRKKMPMRSLRRDNRLIAALRANPHAHSKDSGPSPQLSSQAQNKWHLKQLKERHPNFLSWALFSKTPRRRRTDEQERSSAVFTFQNILRNKQTMDSKFPQQKYGVIALHIQIKARFSVNKVRLSTSGSA